MLDVARCGTCLRILNLPRGLVALSATTGSAVTGAVCIHRAIDPSSLDRVGVGNETRAPVRSVALRIEASNDKTGERLRQQRQLVQRRGIETVDQNERRNPVNM